MGSDIAHLPLDPGDLVYIADQRRVATFVFDDFCDRAGIYRTARKVPSVLTVQKIQQSCLF